MTNYVTAQTSYSKDGTRSMGTKLLLVCGLALMMWLPSLFVYGLVSDRRQGPEASMAAAGQAGGPQVIPGSTVRVVASYRSVDRSLKYVLLFLGLVFLTYFGFEATTGKRVHPAQYVLVGTAQIIFYLLLLSLAEKAGFDWAFLISGVATVSLLSVNAGWVFGGQQYGWRAAGIFTPLYTLIYMLLRLEFDALLIGAVASFAAVAGVMYLTRGLDWYGTLAAVGVGGGAVPPPKVSESWLE